MFLDTYVNLPKYLSTTEAYYGRQDITVVILHAYLFSCEASSIIIEYNNNY